MTAFLLGHGYAVLFAAMLVGQLGIPIPAIPLLLAAGVLARSGEISVAGALVVTVVASVLGHVAWYEAGRRRGTAVLRLLCKIAIEPDSCVRRTEDLFVRHGPGALVAAPFIPGLSTIAPPLAGMSAMPLPRFLFLDGAGEALFAGVFLALGFAAGPQLVSAMEVAMRFGGYFALSAAVAFSLWLSWKIVQRSTLLRALRIPRIEAGDLLVRLGSADPPLVVDLRSELISEGTTIPGAHRVLREELPQWAAGVPRAREIILACD